jgi:hypothetical protein
VNDNELPTFQSRMNTRFEIKNILDNLCIQEVESRLSRLNSYNISPNINISPIFKKGSRLIAANYRPVSLTSVVCKLLEGIIRDIFMDYLVNNKLISKDQHGF